MESVAVDFDRKTATVAMRPGRPLPRGEVETALSDAGYTVTAFENERPPGTGSVPPPRP